MNLSKEKLELFERLYKEENEAYARDESPNIPEFNDEEFLDEYRDWRIDAYEAPRNRKLDVELVRIYALEDIAEAEAALAAVEAMKKGGPDVMPMRTAKLEYFEDIYRADEEARKQKKPFDHEAFQSPDYREEYHNWKRDLKEKPMSKSHLPVASKVLTPGEINRGVAKRDVDSKRMTPATRADVYESKSQRRDAAAPSTALCWAWS